MSRELLDPAETAERALEAERGATERAGDRCPVFGHENCDDPAHWSAP